MRSPGQQLVTLPVLPARVLKHSSQQVCVEGVLGRVQGQSSLASAFA